MITAELPNVTVSGRYSITETCKALGIHRNTLRRFTDEGLIRCGFRKMNARKFYQGSEILRFWQEQM